MLLLLLLFLLARSPSFWPTDSGKYAAKIAKATRKPFARFIPILHDKANIYIFYFIFPPPLFFCFFELIKLSLWPLVCHCKLCVLAILFFISLLIGHSEKKSIIKMACISPISLVQFGQSYLLFFTVISC